MLQIKSPSQDLQYCSAQKKWGEKGLTNSYGIHGRKARSTGDLTNKPRTVLVILTSPRVINSASQEMNSTLPVSSRGHAVLHGNGLTSHGRGEGEKRVHDLTPQIILGLC